MMACRMLRQGGMGYVVEETALWRVVCRKTMSFADIPAILPVIIIVDNLLGKRFALLCCRVATLLERVPFCRI